MRLMRLKLAVLAVVVCTLLVANTGAYFSDTKKTELSFQMVLARCSYIHACRCKNKVCIKNTAEFSIKIITSNCGISNYIMYPGEKLCIHKNTTATFTFEDGSKLRV